MYAPPRVGGRVVSVNEEETRIGDYSCTVDPCAVIGEPNKGNKIIISEGALLNGFETSRLIRLMGGLPTEEEQRRRGVKSKAINVDQYQAVQLRSPQSGGASVTV